MKLLGHSDFAFARRRNSLSPIATESIPLLSRAAKEDSGQLTRLHAIWGLGQLGRRREGRKPLCSYLKDADAEVRRQAARVLGWQKECEAHELLPLLRDGEPRVRCQAALTLSLPNVRFSQNEIENLWKTLLNLIEDNADRDAICVTPPSWPWRDVRKRNW